MLSEHDFERIRQLATEGESEVRGHRKLMVPLNKSIDDFKQYFCDKLKCQGPRESYLRRYKWKREMYSVKEEAKDISEGTHALDHDAFRLPYSVEVEISHLKDNKEARAYEIMKWAKFNPTRLSEYTTGNPRKCHDRINEVFKVCGWIPSCTYDKFTMVNPTAYDIDNVDKYYDGWESNMSKILADNGIGLQRVIEEYVIKDGLKLKRTCRVSSWEWLIEAQKSIKTGTGMELIDFRNTRCPWLPWYIIEMISDYVIMIG